MKAKEPTTVHLEKILFIGIPFIFQSTLNCSNFLNQIAGLQQSSTLNLQHVSGLDFVQKKVTSFQ